MKNTNHILAICLSLGLSLMPVSSQAAITLAEVNFSGTANAQISTSTIPGTDPQFTELASVIPTANASLAVIGGTASTAHWFYNGSGTAALNNDLHTATSFGAPTRMDFILGLANPGTSYTLTSVEITLPTATTRDIRWEFGYRKPDTTTVILGTQTINAAGTYSIDISGASLSADDTSQSWVSAGNGGLRFMFFETTSGTNADGLQIDSLRVIGTAIPEPSAALLGGLGLLALLRRRRN
ncbi:PEP-CTERM sorting domain-containing protein [Akkermansiaceae bacterium]|nr:PEP-CTERM sorting domain-containing protein [Akkermansiaceae bacterium]